MTEITEGGVTVTVEEPRDGASDGTSDAVFYNPEMELNRDVTVAVLRAHAHRRERDGQPTYVDATAASGVRATRAAAEGYAVTAADVDPDAVALARENLTDTDGTAVQRDANALLHESSFDVVDLDPYGSPVPFADAASGGHASWCV
ncbi:MAG: N2,N2-dimethylguanosine tRNA methyltransferase [halophilic archaeon J07HB67]|nr:MAG: N2,N2-dimethylguanosine tRNA methyltransferase [halophilic archaeon J07HB67]